jgi:hypothetical protein
VKYTPFRFAPIQILYPHTDSERHTASVAQEKADKYFIEYEQALAKWHEGASFPDFYPENTDNSYTQDQSE